MDSIVKYILPFVLTLLQITVARSQQDTATNSFEATYKQFNPSLHYKYNEAKQTHDYSNNWDLDKDGKTDRVYFVGTGGAHLYYYLRVILSSDNKVRNFTFLESDLPLLPKEIVLQKPGYTPKHKQTFFSVFDNNNAPAIFIRLDQSSFTVARNDLKKNGVKTNFIALSFSNGKPQFKDHTESH